MRKIRSRNGEVLKRVSRKRHACNPPGWRGRRRLDLDYGSVWMCDCGTKWIWTAPYLIGYSRWVRHLDEPLRGPVSPSGVSSAADSARGQR